MSKFKQYMWEDGYIRCEQEYEGQPEYISSGDKRLMKIKMRDLTLKDPNNSITLALSDDARRIASASSKRRPETFAECRTRELTPVLGPKLARFAASINLHKRTQRR